MQQNWSDGQKPGEELSDYLFSQLLLADYGEKEKEIVEFLVFSLDERGYFTDGITSVAERFQVSEEMIESLLKDIQSLDPAGVGARDLTECLLLQLDRKRKDLKLQGQLSVIIWGMWQRIIFPILPESFRYL